MSNFRIFRPKRSGRVLTDEVAQRLFWRFCAFNLPAPVRSGVEGRPFLLSKTQEVVPDQDFIKKTASLLGEKPDLTITITDGSEPDGNG